MYLCLLVFLCTCVLVNLWFCVLVYLFSCVHVYLFNSKLLILCNWVVIPCSHISLQFIFHHISLPICLEQGETWGKKISGTWRKMCFKTWQNIVEHVFPKTAENVFRNMVKLGGTLRNMIEHVIHNMENGGICVREQCGIWWNIAEDVFRNMARHAWTCLNMTEHDRTWSSMAENRGE